MIFRPAKLGQYQPSTKTSAKDCVPTVAAQLVARATVDAIRTDHAVIRQWVLAHGGGRKPDGSLRGLYLTEARDAVQALFGVELEVVYGVSRATLRDTVAGGHACGVMIDCSVTLPTRRRTNNYAGLHELFVPEYRWWAGGATCGCEKQTTAPHVEYLVDDPGTTLVGYLWWSGDLLYHAAEAVGGIHLLVAPDTEGATWIANGGWSVRTHPSTTDGLTVGKLTKGAKYYAKSTQNGGPWQRADGTNATGWTRVLFNNHLRWVPGRAARHA